MNQYKVVFFDLDRTLVDFDTNAKLAFRDMYHSHKLEQLGVPDDKHFYDTYMVHNLMLWDLYNKGEIKKEVLKSQRFKLVLADYHVQDDMLANELSEQYLENSLKYNVLFPEVKETLDYLLAKGYSLAIITNGFVEIQYRKLKKSGLDKYFSVVVTSDEVGHKKPDERIFLHACALANVSPKDAVMIGDDWDNDIVGAVNVGMDPVLFNPRGVYDNPEVKYEIKEFSRLREIL